MFYFTPFLMRRHYFIINMGAEAPLEEEEEEEQSFYLLFERGGAISLVKFWRRLVEIFYLYPKLR